MNFDVVKECGSELNCSSYSFEETTGDEKPNIPNPFLLSPKTQDENLKKRTKTFCCYNCLNLFIAQCFFPVLSSRNSVLKRSNTLGLRPQTCTTFSQHCFPALKNSENKQLTLGKTFLTAFQTIIATKCYLQLYQIGRIVPNINLDIRYQIIFFPQCSMALQPPPRSNPQNPDKTMFLLFLHIVAALTC